MKKFIDAEEVISLIRMGETRSDYEYGAGFNGGIAFAIERITQQSPADVRENFKGDWWCDSQWVDEAGAFWFIWKCRKCGNVHNCGWENTKDEKKPKANFCENCGADLRGDNNG